MIRSVVFFLLFFVSSFVHAQEGQQAERDHGRLLIVEEPAQRALRACAIPYVGDLTSAEIDLIYLDIERQWGKKLTGKECLVNSYAEILAEHGKYPSCKALLLEKIGTVGTVKMDGATVTFRVLDADHLTNFFVKRYDCASSLLQDAISACDALHNRSITISDPK